MLLQEEISDDLRLPLPAIHVGASTASIPHQPRSPTSGTPRSSPIASSHSFPSQKSPEHGCFIELLAEAGIEASVGSVGDSYDKALLRRSSGFAKPKYSRPSGRGMISKPRDKVGILVNESLFQIRVRQRTLHVLPWIAIRTFAIALSVICLAAFAMELIGIPYLEKQGRISAAGWKHEQVKLVNSYRQRNHAVATGDVVWRSPGLPVVAAKKTAKRILVMGDSFVWGYGNADVNLLWWRQLERELHRRGYTDLEVIAAGLSGWPTKQQLSVVRSVAAQYSPDLVIWGYVTNDPDEGLLPQSNTPKALGWVYTRIAQALPGLAVLVAERRDRKLAAQGETYESWELSLLRGRNWDVYQETLAELGRFMHETEVPSFLMTLPNAPSREYFAERYAPLLASCARAGVVCIDILDAFLRKYGNVPRDGGSEILSWGANPADGHPGPRSVRFFAERAADVIEQNYPGALPARSQHQPGQGELAVNDWVPESLMGKRPEQGHSIDLVVPAESELLHMPLERPYFQLNFAEPVDLETVRIQGAGLSAAAVYLTEEDPATHVDSAIPQLVGELSASGALELGSGGQGRLVTSVLVAPTFHSDDRALQITFTPARAP